MTLLHAIEACLRQTSLPPSRFGREAVSDPRLVHDLRRGRQPGASVERRAREYIARLTAAHRNGHTGHAHTGHGCTGDGRKGLSCAQ